MHNLKDTTFIIPICIETLDRYNNAKTTLRYLNHHFNTNIILHEFHNGKSKLDFLDTLTNLNIVKHIEEDNGLEYYHKTRQINEMLEFVETDITFMHDVDIVLPIESYINTELCLKYKHLDFVYPFTNGDFVNLISTGFDRSVFNIEFNIELIPEKFIDVRYVDYGYCHALSTNLYKKIGRENENFKQWGPEDEELNIRIKKMNLNVGRISDASNVYHFNHYKTNFSTNDHQYKDENYNLIELIKNMNYEEIVGYYNTADYLKKYKK